MLGDKTPRPDQVVLSVPGHPDMAKHTTHTTTLTAFVAKTLLLIALLARVAMGNINLVACLHLETQSALGILERQNIVI